MFLRINLVYRKLAYCRTSSLEVLYYRTFVGDLVEVLYIYNPQNEALMTPHEQEVQELYEKLTVEIPGIKAGRAISLDSFQHAIDLMMNKAYKYGQFEGFQKAEGIVHQVFETR